MKEVSIYHNNRCSKSRQALQILEEKEITLNVINYMQEPITEEALQEILTKLKIKPAELLRKGEGDYKNHVKDKDLSDQELIQLMIEFPKLMERPIVIVDAYAVVARPPELVNKLLNSENSD